ncbi:MAG: hypothetical protein MHPSP_001913, partial [Paramarteilia canceri]
MQSGGAVPLSGPEATPQEESGSCNEKEDFKDEKSNFFKCNVCFDPVDSPVVTDCGHLY